MVDGRSGVAQGFLCARLSRFTSLLAERCGGTLLFLSVLLTGVLASPQLLPAAVIVDPDGVGATDVDPVDPATWTGDTDAYVGKSASGVLRIDGASRIESYSARLALEFGSIGDVTVEGPGSTWACRYYLYVGEHGSGTLRIAGGAAVSSYYGYIGWSSGSIGVVMVDGPESKWTNTYSLYVGDHHGTGRLDVVNGGRVTVTGVTQVGRASDSQGTIHFDDGTLDTRLLMANNADLTGRGTILLHGVVTDDTLVLDTPDDLTRQYRIDSAPSQDITVNLTIDSQGYFGAGNLGVGCVTINNGLTVASTRGYAGYYSGSTGNVTVDGPHSNWTISGDLYVGYKGNGTLNIDGGGTVSSDWGLIADAAGSSGAVMVHGPGSIWTNSGELHVGSHGSGTLEITGGGVVSTGFGSDWYFSYIGSMWNSSGAVKVHGIGSKWTNSGSLSVGGLGSGTLNVLAGGTVSSAYGSVGTTSLSSGRATVDGLGSAWSIDTVLVVGGYGNGTMEITNGGLVSVGDALTIDERPGGRGCINMAAGGMLALLGDADDSLAAFLNLINGTDAIRYWNESTSTWSAIAGATYGDDYTLSYLTEGDLAGYTILTVLTTTVPADANWDGMVNELDAAALAAHWGQTGGWSDGDFIHDGLVNAADASILAANWEHGTGESTAVPEPSMLVMLVASLAFLLARWHR